MTMNRLERCENCRYWKPAFDCDWGICHRNPPAEEGYPGTCADDSCADFIAMIGISCQAGVHEDPVTEVPSPG